ncbi:TIGR03086 family metal-binding protein [Actinoplanes sp. NPDC051513]|uniref:TIGR03086 family metal-binding protein n=1 Tax=Actinoplanes sp. NPDC051513 TaxID=3363908 RepID=UPI0037B61EEA
MTTRISELLATAAERTVAVVDGIEDDQLLNPTPCTEYQVRDLVNHLFQGVVNFQALAAKQPVDWAAAPDFIDGDWRSRFAQETRKVVEAWSDPAAVEGDNPAMGMSQELVANLALVDLTVHGWDLAQGTGQDFTPAPEVVAAIGPFTEQMAPSGREMGVFAEMTDFPPDADDFVRLLAHTGRKAG